MAARRDGPMTAGRDAAPAPTVVAVTQLSATQDVEANLQAMERLVAQAVEQGAEVVFAPETPTFIGPAKLRAKMLEPLPAGGPILDRCRRMAADNEAHFVFGFHEAAAAGRAFNTLIHMGPAGDILALYRKIHLFDVDLPDGTRLWESRNTAAGDAPTVTAMPFGTLGLSVCYDVRFPMLYQRLVDAGAIALAVPAAFTRTTGREHWHVLLRARAIECQSYVIAAAQHGRHGHGNRESYGHALIVDPWGEVIAECPAEGDAVAVATIDPARVAAVRQQLPSLRHRAPAECAPASEAAPWRGPAAAEATAAGR